MPQTYHEIDLKTGLEPDEIEALEDGRAEGAEMERLQKDKGANYSMLRALKPIANSDGIGVGMFMELYESLSDFHKKIVLFKEWRAVEGGEIQVRVNPNGSSDDHGYAVVRPQEDKEHDLYLRVWTGLINSVVILPRSNDPLPRQGKLKDSIIEQMRLVPRNKLDGYAVWLKRMKKVE